MSEYGEMEQNDSKFPFDLMKFMTSYEDEGKFVWNPIYCFWNLSNWI